MRINKNGLSNQLSPKSCFLSVVIPTYNCKKYLQECLESIIKQTFINYELILVDDGSTDGTVEYLKCLRSALPKQTKIFYFDHKGAANARNFGLSQVAGEYVLFLDSDDFFEAYFFEKLYENISQNNKPDLVVCEFWIFSDKEKKDVKHKKLCLPNEAREITNSSLIYFLSPNVWNKCFNCLLYTSDAADE